MASASLVLLPAAYAQQTSGASGASAAEEKELAQATPPPVTVTGVSVAGGVNEGGGAGQVSMALETRGIGDHIQGSEAEISLQGGNSSHFLLDASIIPIELKTWEFKVNNGGGHLSVTLTPTTIDLDGNYNFALPKKAEVDGYFTAPVQGELFVHKGRFSFGASFFGGPTAGFLCVHRGCVSLPGFTPSVGTELMARVGLPDMNAIELAVKATYLVSTDTSKFGTDNGSGEAHAYFVHTTHKGNDWYLGPMAAFDNKDAKRAGDVTPSENLNYTFFAVAGVRFRDPGEKPAQ